MFLVTRKGKKKVHRRIDRAIFNLLDSFSERENERLLQIFNFIHVVLWRRTDTKGKMVLSVPFSNAFDEHWYWQVWNKHRWRHSLGYQTEIRGAREEKYSKISNLRRDLSLSLSFFPSFSLSLRTLWSIDFVIQTWRLASRSNARDRTL